jgi:hypothetical protein
MADPCQSAWKISAIDERTKAHGEAIGSVKTALESLTSALNKISEALSDIRHLREDQQRNERDFDELFGRVRILELAPGKAMGRAGWMILTAISGSIGGVVSGTVVWIVTKG